MNDDRTEHVMSSSDERAKALADVIRQQLAGQLVDEYGETPAEWAELGSTRRISRRLAEHIADSPAMRDLLAEERAKALREAAEEADSIGHHWSGAPDLAFFALAGDLRDRAEGDR